MRNLQIPASPGEVLDKLQILEIKLEKIIDPDKLRNIQHEFNVLNEYWQQFTKETAIQPDPTLIQDLKLANLEIWEAEEIVRQCEREKDFTTAFIGSARSIYFSNDRRAARKRTINTLYGTDLIEEKSHARY